VDLDRAGGDGEMVRVRGGGEGDATP